MAPEEAYNWRQIIMKLSYQSGRMVIKKCDVSVAVSFGAEKEILPAGTSGHTGRESGVGKRSVEVCEM